MTDAFFLSLKQTNKKKTLFMYVILYNVSARDLVRKGMGLWHRDRVSVRHDRLR